MLRLSPKTLLAIEAVLDIAYNARPEPVQARDITRRQGIPARHLEQVFQQLVRNGVLKGVRGPRGGYTLARERRRISVGEIVRLVGALEGAPDAPASRAELGARVVAPLWEEVQGAVLARLDRITIEDLCRRAERAGVTRAVPADPDFSI
ncbi:MAG: Rrf2 family transcriptional regulator [Alphaproteobacteria bacterium]|nr:MAG: Rrf2 family transcriptional regulator [Alphaproteobacteria bacterium]